MRFEDLAVLVLEVERTRAMEDAGYASADRRAVTPRFEPEAGGLDADEPGPGIDKPREGPHRVRATAHARDDHVGIPSAEPGPALLARLVTHDALELADHPRIRMRSDDGSDAVVRRLHGRHPVAQRFIDRVLQGRTAALDRNHVRAEQTHPHDVERLAL